MRLALDNHYSPLIAVRLRELGHDVVAATERGWVQEDDEPLLALCTQDGRALLTNNVRDFVVLARAWAAVGRSHAGLIFTSDASLPRHRDTVGRFVQALADLMGANPEEAGFRDRVHWL